MPSPPASSPAGSGSRFHEQARSPALVTTHVGEKSGAYGIAEIREVVSIPRDRIGHGILAAQNEKLMNQIGKAGIVLEICPSSTCWRAGSCA
jgi:adenosine deaminase